MTKEEDKILGHCSKQLQAMDLEVRLLHCLEESEAEFIQKPPMSVQIW